MNDSKVQYRYSSISDYWVAYCYQCERVLSRIDTRGKQGMSQPQDIGHDCPSAPKEKS